MRFVEPDAGEKRFFGSFALHALQPLGGFLDHYPAGIAFDLSGRSSVANEIDGIEMAGSRVVVGAQGIFESLVGRIRLFRFEPGKVPFAEMAGAVSLLAAAWQSVKRMPSAASRSMCGVWMRLP